MIYSFAITVPANTAEANALLEHLKMDKGIIHRFEAEFPVGCAGLAHCRVLNEGAHIFPSNPADSLSSDGYAIAFDEQIELTNAPFTLEARLWNTDDTYAHTITLRFGILRGEGALLFVKVVKGLAKMLQYMGFNV